MEYTKESANKFLRTKTIPHCYSVKDQHKKSLFKNAMGKRNPFTSATKT